MVPTMRAYTGAFARRRSRIRSRSRPSSGAKMNTEMISAGTIGHAEPGVQLVVEVRGGERDRAVREVEDARRLVRQHEPRRHDRVDRAGDQPGDDEVQELVHALRGRSPARLAEVGVAHGLVAWISSGRPVREHGAEVEHHDTVAVLHDEPGVVLDEEHGATGLVAHGLDLLAEPFGLGLVETRRRLVEQQQLRLVDDRARELDHPRDADRQRTGELLADRQSRPHRSITSSTRRRRSRSRRAAGREHDEVGEEPAATAVPLERGEHVVLDRQPSEGLDPLERASQAAAGALRPPTST